MMNPAEGDAIATVAHALRTECLKIFGSTWNDANAEALARAAVAAMPARCDHKRYSQRGEGRSGRIVAKWCRDCGADLMLAAKEAPPIPWGYELVPIAALKWLNGLGPDDRGFHFGDSETMAVEFRGKRPTFWRRTVFNRMRCAKRQPAPPSEWALIQKLREGEGDSITLCCDKPDFGPGPEAIVTFNGHMTNWQDKDWTGDTVLQALQACAADLDKFNADLRVNTVHCRFIDPTFRPATHKGRAP